MPTYEYQCKECKYTFEEFEPMSALPLKTCPSCKKDGLVRVIGAGSGLIFKGTGFYITDYKRNTGGDGKAKNKEARDPPSKKSSKTDHKATDSPPTET